MPGQGTEWRHPAKPKRGRSEITGGRWDVWETIGSARAVLAIVAKEVSTAPGLSLSSCSASHYLLLQYLLAHGTVQPKASGVVMVTDR